MKHRKDKSGPYARCSLGEPRIVVGLLKCEFAAAQKLKDTGSYLRRCFLGFCEDFLILGFLAFRDFQ